MLTPALEHSHFRIFERPQHTNQTFRGMKEVRQKTKYERAQREVQHFQLQQRISSVFCQNPAGHHPTNQFTPISLIPPVRVHGGSQGGLGAEARTHVATRQVRARTSVNDVLASQCNGTSALNTTDNNCSSNSLNRFHVGHVCSDIGKQNMVHAHLFKRESSLFIFTQNRSKLRVAKFTQVL